MTQKLELYLQNLDCENEAARIEGGLRGLAGLRTITVFPSAAKIVADVDDAGAAERVKEMLVSLGFPERKRNDADAGPPPPWRNPKVLSSLTSGVLLLVGFLVGIAEGPALVQTAIYVVGAGVGGYFFVREAVENLMRKEIGIEMLMTAAAVAAIALGEAGEGAMLAFLYSISEAAEGYTAERTRSAVRALMKLAPKTATVRRGGKELEVEAEELVVGDVFLVRPGQAMPTDGVVVAGGSSVNQAPITGESVPVEKKVGNDVFAGTLNEEGSLEVRVTQPWGNNTLSRIISMVEEAQEKKASSERFIERFGSRYSPLVLLGGLLLAIVPQLFGGDASVWLMRATVFVVAAAPCALVISIPITMVATLGTAARRGILIKGGAHVDDLARVNVVALDKTGTITSGEPEVTDVVVAVEGDELSMLRRAAAVERKSQHPLARAVARFAASNNVDVVDAEGFSSLTGAGAIGRVDGTTVVVAKPAHYTRTLGVDLGPLAKRVEELEGEGKTVVVVGDGVAAHGLLALRDQVRPNAKKAISELHRLGVKVVMLTGDNERAGRAVAKEVGIDEIHAGLTPAEKSARVKVLAAAGAVAMVGDGVNDAPALAAATVGVAMGAAGTDVALETADVALMGDDLERLVEALQLARRSQSVVRQNLALSVVVIGSLVVGAVAGAFSLPVAVVAHELSEMIVIASGLRMLRA
jgi:heavy metal translocating P-type ATPase